MHDHNGEFQESYMFKSQPSPPTHTYQFFHHLVSPPLPPGKKWHVFVSHSTADKQWARESVIVPLRSPPHNFQVAACYNFMPDITRYNDSDIHSSLRQSCVILIGISPAYLGSQRWVRLISIRPYQIYLLNRLVFGEE